VSDWPLSESQLITAGLLSVMLIVLIVTAFRKAGITRKEFARVREDVKRLSEEMKELQEAEQRRFINELNATERTTDLGRGGLVRRLTVQRLQIRQ
jgi:hypothetical protein